jgi:hypothetical protein
MPDDLGFEPDGLDFQVDTPDPANDPTTFVGPEDQRGKLRKLADAASYGAIQFAEDHPVLTDIAKRFISGPDMNSPQAQAKGVIDIQGPGMMTIPGSEGLSEFIRNKGINTGTYAGGFLGDIASQIVDLGGSGFDPRTAGVKTAPTPAPDLNLTAAIKDLKVDPNLTLKGALGNTAKANRPVVVEGGTAKLRPLPSSETVNTAYGEALKTADPIASAQAKLDALISKVTPVEEQGAVERLIKSETGALRLRGKSTDEISELRERVISSIGRGGRINLADLYTRYGRDLSKRQFEKVIDDIIGSGDLERAYQATAKPVEATRELKFQPIAEAQTPEQAIDILLNNVKAQTAARLEQDVLVSAERKARIKEAMNVREGGLSGYFKQLSKLKGEYPKVEAAIKNELISPENTNVLMDMIQRQPGLNDWDRIGAKSALSRVLGIRPLEGALAPHEIADLERVFGTKATEQLVELHGGLGAVSPGSNIGRAISQGGGITKSLKASMDFPGIFRAGINYTGQKAWRDAVVPGLRAYFSPKYADNVLEQLKTDPAYEFWHNNGLAITDYKSANPLNREEAIASLTAEKIPVLGIGVRASNRGQTVFADVMRFEKAKSIFKKYETLYDSLKKTTSPEELEQIELLNPANPHRAKLIADEVNVATGRGKLPGKLEAAASDINNLFFSPRLMSARMRSVNRILNPASYANYNKIQRTEAIKQLLSIAGVLGSTTAGASMLGYELGTNPLSTDFLKLKKDDTRIDALAGYQQLIVPAIRLLAGARATGSGKVDLLGDYGAPSAGGIVGGFLENKESPFLAFATALANRQEFAGKPLDFTSINPFQNTAARQLVTPMIAQDIYDLFEHEPELLDTLAIVPATLGMGVSTYSPDDYKEEKDANKEVRKLRRDRLRSVFGSDSSSVR